MEFSENSENYSFERLKRKYFRESEKEGGKMELDMDLDTTPMLADHEKGKQGSLKLGGSVCEKKSARNVKDEKGKEHETGGCGRKCTCCFLTVPSTNAYYFSPVNVVMAVGKNHKSPVVWAKN